MAGFAGTGGTAAPSPSPAPLRSIRASGAAQALGAPKGVTRARPGKMPGKTAKAPVRLPGQGGEHPSRGIGRASVQHAQPRPVVAFNPAERSYSEGQLAQLGQRQAQTQANAELGRFRSQALETAAQERAVQDRYTGYANTTQSLLGQQQQEAQASAKTFENQQAENALKAGKAIETAGQNAATLTGGYLDPAVKAQLASESQRAGAAGTAGNAFAANLGQNESNFMGNLRAAAAQKATEGHGQIAGAYGKQLGLIQGKEAEATSKVIPNSLRFASELGQKQLTDQATLKGLGIKLQTLGAKVAEGKAKLAVTERGQNLKTQETKERVKATERGQTLAQYRAAEANRVKERGQNITREDSRERVKASLEKAANKPSPTLNKLSSELSAAYTTIQELRSGKSPAPNNEIREILTRGHEITKREGKAVKETVPKVSNQTLITAAMELWDNHTISSHTASALKMMGMNPPAEWTNGQFKGF